MEAMERPKTPKREPNELQMQDDEMNQKSNERLQEEENTQNTQNNYQQESQVHNKESPENQYNSPQPIKFQDNTEFKLAESNEKRSSPKKYKSNRFYINRAPVHRQPWNDRFYLSTVQNNARSYPFFKEYFDKPPRQNMQKVLPPQKPEIPVEAFYRTSSIAQLIQKSPQKFQQNQKKDLLALNRPTSSQTDFNQNKFLQNRSSSLKTLLVKEINWDDKFNVMQSKNNVRVHNNFKEFFDRPVQYDPKGFSQQEYYLKQITLNSSQKFEPMKIYEGQTPILKNLQSTINLKRSAQHSDRYLQSAQLQKRRMIKTSHSQNRQKKSSLQDTGKKSQSQNFFNTLSTKPSSKGTLRGSWNERIGLPISTYNENVFPKYKVNFDDL